VLRQREREVTSTSGVETEREREREVTSTGGVVRQSERRHLPVVLR